ncbi:unnamed protein product, partial [Sphenostylis stenocarpa]
TVSLISKKIHLYARGSPDTEESSGDPDGTKNWKGQGQIQALNCPFESDIDGALRNRFNEPSHNGHMR